MLMFLVVCASLAALALGVLIAYALCRLLFILFRHHAAAHMLPASKHPAATPTTNVAHTSLGSALS